MSQKRSKSQDCSRKGRAAARSAGWGAVGQGRAACRPGPGSQLTLGPVTPLLP